jgi:hypothetical protein
VLPDRRTVASFAIAFVVFLAILMAPWPGLGIAYGRAVTATGNLFVAGHAFESGASLVFEDASEGTSAKKFAWQTRLVVRNAAGRRVNVPIDLRTLAYLPTAAFVALALALPFRDRRRKGFVAIVGLALMQPITAFLVALPLFPFLGGGGPIRVFELGSVSSSLMEVAYRALVAPPGMTYAIPALLFLALVALTDPKTKPGAKIEQWLTRIGPRARVEPAM